jgi:putative peptide zinc metalloprotease protein
MGTSMTLATERPTAAHPVAGCPRRRVHQTSHSVDRTDSAGFATTVVEKGPPQLAEGVQLLGEYAGTGYREPQYVARRPGGQMVQLSRLLHLIAEQCDGSSREEDIAERVSHTFGKAVSPDNVHTLIEGKLRPLGVLAAADGSSPAVETSDPLLALKLRKQLLRPGVVGALATLARPVFWPPVVVAVVAGLIAVDVWLFFVHGLGSGIRASVQQPAVFLLVMAVVVVSAALHELGHAAACAYGGAKPGGMGAGIYVVWPAFYTDVTDAYRLDRGGRLRTDLGGVYINAIIVIIMAGGYAVTGYEPLVLLCFLLQIVVLQQMLPFLRLDGYYVLSDLVGVPDLFRRVGPVLRSALPFRDPEPSVAQLKPWVRRVVAGWVFVLVPVLALNLGYFLLAAPRIFATGWDSASRLIGTMTSSEGVDVAWSGVQLVLLLLPAIGMTYTFIRIAKRGTVGAWRWSAGSAPRRATMIGGVLGLLTLLAVVWYPDGRMTPYREGERGTLQEHVAELNTLGQGDPLLRSPAEALTPLPPTGRISPVVTQEPAPTPSVQQQPSTARPSPAPVPSPAGATTPAPPALATGGVGQLESVAPEVIEDLPVPVPEDPESLVPEVIDEVPAPAVPGPQDVSSFTSAVPTLPGQIVQDATPALDVPSIPGPTGLIPNG